MEKYNLLATNSILLANLAIRLMRSLRVIMRTKEPSVTQAWLVIILIFPFIGAILHLVMGENRLGRKQAEAV